MVKISTVLSPVSWRGIRASIMPICFNLTLPLVSNRIHTTPLPPRHWTKLPPGINLRTYNIRDSHVIGLPQAIRAIQLGYYNLMLLMETNILNAV